MCFSPDVLAPQYPWQSNDMSVNMLPPNHSSDFLLEPPGHNKENEDDVEVMSTDSSSSSSDSDWRRCVCGLCRLQGCSVLQTEMQTIPLRSSPLQTKWGFCLICQTTVCRLVRITVVLGSYIAALEKRLKDMTHNLWGLLDRTLSQAWCVYQ